MNTLSKILTTALILASGSNIYSQTNVTPKGRQIIKQGTLPAGAEQPKKDLPKGNTNYVKPASTEAKPARESRFGVGLENNLIYMDYSVKTSTKNWWATGEIAYGKSNEVFTKIREGTKFDGKGAINKDETTAIFSIGFLKNYSLDGGIGWYLGPVASIVYKDKNIKETAGIYDKSGSRLSYSEDSKNEKPVYGDAKLRIGANFNYKKAGIDVSLNLSARGENTVKAGLQYILGRGAQRKK